MPCAARVRRAIPGNRGRAFQSPPARVPEVRSGRAPPGYWRASPSEPAIPCEVRSRHLPAWARNPLRSGLNLSSSIYNRSGSAGAAPAANTWRASQLARRAQLGRRCSRPRGWPYANLFRERHLGTNHLLGGRAIELRASDQSFELEAWRAGHDHDEIAQGFTTGFIEKRNVSKKKIGRVVPAFGFEAPLTADARMQDLLQRAFLVRVAEDYRAHLGPISSLPVAEVKIAGPNSRPIQLSHLVIVLGPGRGPPGPRRKKSRRARSPAGICRRSFSPWKFHL